MLKEIADKAALQIGVASGEAKCRTAFCLLDEVQHKLQARGLYGDVLATDAACMCTDKPNALFLEQCWQMHLDHLVQNAFGLQQQAETL